MLCRRLAYPLIAAWTVFRVPELRWARGPVVAFFLLLQRYLAGGMTAGAVKG